MWELRADRRETWITGIGLVSSLGDGLEANWDAAVEPKSADVTIGGAAAFDGFC
jgi:3-oxoacyl-(acyl-carrier-protein) synthase